MLKGTSLKATAAIVLLLCLACTVSTQAEKTARAFITAYTTGIIPIWKNGLKKQ